MLPFSSQVALTATGAGLYSTERCSLLKVTIVSYMLDRSWIEGAERHGLMVRTLTIALS